MQAQSGDAAIRKLQGMFTDVQDESIAEVKTKFEGWNKGSTKVENVDLEVQVSGPTHTLLLEQFPEFDVLVLTLSFFRC